jgi:hypothetical protein
MGNQVSIIAPEGGLEKGSNQELRCFRIGREREVVKAFGKHGLASQHLMPRWKARATNVFPFSVDDAGNGRVCLSKLPQVLLCRGVGGESAWGAGLQVGRRAVSGQRQKSFLHRRCGPLSTWVNRHRHTAKLLNPKNSEGLAILPQNGVS